MKSLFILISLIIKIIIINKEVIQFDIKKIIINVEAWFSNDNSLKNKIPSLSPKNAHGQSSCFVVLLFSKFRNNISIVMKSKYAVKVERQK